MKFICVFVVGFFATIAWKPTFGATEIVHTNEKELFIDGDIILGGLFNVHKRGNQTENSCGGLDPNPGYQYFASALFVIKEINKNPNILRGIKLGARIYDTCRSQTIGADGAKELIKYTLQQTNSTPPLTGVIGPFRSDVAIAVANLLRVFNIPQVSFGATVVKLSNKDIYSYFLRTVPPNSFQGRALVDVVQNFGWTYVMTVFSPGLYGEPGMDEVYQAAKVKGLCIAYKKRLKPFPKTEDYENVIRELIKVSERNKESDLNVVLMFCIQRDNTGLVAAAKKILTKTHAKRFVWVASNSWGAREPVTNGNEEGGEGAITLNYVTGNVDRFKAYFLNLRYNSSNDTWFQEFWQQSMKCRIKGARKELNFNDSCLPDKKLPPDFGIAPVRVSMNAVYAAVYALDAMHRTLCKGVSGMCQSMRELKREVFLKYLKNVSFPDATTNVTVRFNRNGEVDGRYDVLNFRKVNGKYTYVKVGSWRGELQDDDSVKGGVHINSSYIAWPPIWNKTPNSYCSKPCDSTQVENSAIVNPQCCWRCEQCKTTSAVVINNTCHACAPGYRPDANMTSCYKLKVIYSTLSGDSPAQIIITLIAVLGIIGTAVAAGFFVKHRDDRVIKASGRELCVILFVGVMLCYISALFYIVKPSVAACTLRRFLGSVSLSAIYAPVLLRTNRIYRIFKVAQKSVTRPSLISPTSQIIMCLGIIAIQILITSIWFQSDPPRAAMSFQYEHKTILTCSMRNMSVAINLSFNIILMLVSTGYAFLTRNFPRNFNEAKYIGVTMYLSCSVWVVFLPCYLNAVDDIWKSVFGGFAFVFIASITLCGLLVPRVFLVINGATVGPETLTMTMQSSHARQNELEVKEGKCEPNGGEQSQTDEHLQIESMNIK